MAASAQGYNNRCGCGRCCGSATGQTGANRQTVVSPCCPSPTYSEDVVLLATTIANALARGRTICELETLVNVTGMVKDTLLSILTQRAVCARANEIPLEEVDL